MASKIDAQPKASIFFGLTLLLLLSLGIALRSTDRQVESRSPDEKAYSYYANAMRDGLTTFQRSFQEYENDQHRWQYPPPSRVGHFWLVAIAMRILDSQDEEAGALLSCFFSILSLGLLVVFGLRFFNPWSTVPALYWYSLSPMELLISKRAWQDSVFSFFGTALILLTAELSRRAERKWLYLLFIPTAVFAMLVKESGILVLGLCALWLAAARWKDILWIAGAVLSALAAYYFTVGWVLGDLGALLRIFDHIKYAIPSNDYILKYQDGPWYFFLQGLWILCPMALVAALPGMWTALLSRNRQWQAIAGFLLLYGIAAAAPDYFKNLRYSSTLYPIFYLMAGLGYWSFFSWLWTKMSRPVFGVFFTLGLLLTLAIGIRDYQNYRTYFVYLKTPDLACRYLTEMGSAKDPGEYVERLTRGD